MRGRPYIGGLTRSPVGGGDRTPLSPAGGATGPPGGPTGLSPLGWATGACRPLGGRQALFINPNRHSLCDLSLKIQKKSQP